MYNMVPEDKEGGDFEILRWGEGGWEWEERKL